MITGASNERVLGFISIDLNEALQSSGNAAVTGHYDLVDLSHSSSGRVRVSATACLNVNAL
jgi:hypothetical protein